MPIANWGILGLFSGITFIAGWFVFGTTGAILLSVVAMVAIDIIRFNEIREAIPAPPR